MYLIVMAAADIVPAMIFLIPIFLIYQKFLFHDMKKMVLYLVFAAYPVAVVSLVGLPDILYLRFDPTCNLIPFAGILTNISESLLNVVLFIPLGVLLPALWNRYRSLTHTLLFGLGISAIIEFLQIFTFRATDVNDLITNTTGALIGYLIAKLITKGFTRFLPDNPSPRDAWLVFGTVLVGMFFLQSLLSLLIYGSPLGL